MVETTQCDRCGMTQHHPTLYKQVASPSKKEKEAIPNSAPGDITFSKVNEFDLCHTCWEEFHIWIKAAWGYEPTILDNMVRKI